MPGGMPMGQGGFANLMARGGMAKPGMGLPAGMAAMAPDNMSVSPGQGGGDGSWGRRVGGALSGFGQGLMDTGMRRTFGTAGSGGYEDLMQKQKIGDFVRTGGRKKAREIFSDDSSDVTMAAVGGR